MDLVVGTTASYSRGLEFNSQPGGLKSWLWLFLLFLSSSRQRLV